MALEERNAPDMSSERLSCRIFMRDMETTLLKISSRLRAGLGFTLFTLNLDHLIKLRRDLAFRAAYSKATFVTADGWPVAFFARQQDKLVRRTTGADLVFPLCSLAETEGLPIFLLGTSEQALKRAASAIVRQFPNIDICGTLSPPYGFRPDREAAVRVARDIGDTRARICFVALGAPKQELFAAQAAGISPSIGFCCVGGALDFIAGTQRRAPLFIRRNGAEWAWRLASSPVRLGPRYARCVVMFASLAASYVLRHLAGREGGTAYNVWDRALRDRRPIPFDR